MRRTRIAIGVRLDRRPTPLRTRASTSSSTRCSPASCRPTKSPRLSSSRFTASAAVVGGYWRSGLEALADRHPLVGEVRGRGLMIGVELVRDRQTKTRATDERDAVVTAAFARGLLVLGAGKNSVRFSPPLVLTRHQADTAIRIFDEALSEVGRSK